MNPQPLIHERMPGVGIRATNTSRINLPCNSKGNIVSLLELMITWKESHLSHQQLSQLRHWVSQSLTNLSPEIQSVFWKASYPGSQM